jgi:hypothetical protein
VLARLRHRSLQYRADGFHSDQVIGSIFIVIV